MHLRYSGDSKIIYINTNSIAEYGILWEQKILCRIDSRFESGLSEMNATKCMKVRQFN